MARAMCFQIRDVQATNPPNLTWEVELVFVGDDVEGGSRRDTFKYETANTVNEIQLATASAAAIRARAVALGFTIPASSILIQDFVRV